MDQTGSKKRLVEDFESGKTCIWNKKVKDTNLEKFKNIITSKHGKSFATYWDLHEWSVQNYPSFWEEVLNYFNVMYSGSYEQVAKRYGQNITDVDWFSEAKTNFVENLLRYRDNHTAIIYLDGEGTEERVTYDQLYQEVKMYAAAFKKLGLQKGDRVACFMESTKEVIFAMLGAVSLGAIWVTCSPHYGLETASRIFKPTKPKFLITMDVFHYVKAGYNILKNIPIFVNGLDSLLKIIVVPTKPKLLHLDISGAEKSCFLQEFLEYGKNPDGSYSEMTFPQMPFNHPISINYTSGTTGPPKAIVHSAVGLLSILRDFGLHYNIKREDVFFRRSPVDCISWIFNLGCFALGAVLVVYNSNQLFHYKRRFWNLLAQYKVNHAMVIPSVLDKMEENGDIPDSNCNLQHLKTLSIGGYPVSLKNFNFLEQNIKHENLFIYVRYGATESLGRFGGFDFNSPVYSGEIQVPALGVDLKCFDEHGNSVVGQRGEVVIGTPYPGLPTGIWNDPHNDKLNELYFPRHKGVWCQNDECWVDPNTKGIVLIGRCDDVIVISNSQRFNATEIYCVIQDMEELEDYLCFGQSNYQAGKTRCILFVKVKSGFSFSKELVNNIKTKIATDLTIQHVPAIIIEANEMPYNLHNKKMEKIVKTTIETNEIPETSAVLNPECLSYFLNIPELQNFK